MVEELEGLFGDWIACADLNWTSEPDANIPCASLAPYERRVIELLRNSKDKRARKLAKKRVRSISQTLHETLEWTSSTNIHFHSSVPSAVPRPRSMSSSVSSPSPAARATKSKTLPL